MAKAENRVEAVLAKAKIDMAGVDLTKARSKTKGIRFLSVAVREALANVPRVVGMNDAERASVAAWVEKHLIGKSVNPTVVVAACGAALTALEADVRREASPPVPVVAGAGIEAMKRAVLIRKKRSAARAGKAAAKTA